MRKLAYSIVITLLLLVGHAVFANQVVRLNAVYDNGKPVVSKPLHCAKMYQHWGQPCSYDTKTNDSGRFYHTCGLYVTVCQIKDTQCFASAYVDGDNVTMKFDCQP